MTMPSADTPIRRSTRCRIPTTMPDEPPAQRMRRSTPHLRDPVDDEIIPEAPANNEDPVFPVPPEPIRLVTPVSEPMPLTTPSQVPKKSSLRGPGRRKASPRATTPARKPRSRTAVPVRQQEPVPQLLPQRQPLQPVQQHQVPLPNQGQQQPLQQLPQLQSPQHQQLLRTFEHLQSPHQSLQQLIRQHFLQQQGHFQNQNLLQPLQNLNQAQAVPSQEQQQPPQQQAKQPALVPQQSPQQPLQNPVEQPAPQNQIPQPVSQNPTEQQGPVMNYLHGARPATDLEPVLHNLFAAEEHASVHCREGYNYVGKIFNKNGIPFYFAHGLSYFKGAQIIEHPGYDTCFGECCFVAHRPSFEDATNYAIELCKRDKARLAFYDAGSLRAVELNDRDSTVAALTTVRERLAKVNNSLDHLAKILTGVFAEMREIENVMKDFNLSFTPFPFQ